MAQGGACFLQPDIRATTKIIVIVGPTSSGKSELAVKLAKKVNPPAGGEIISADSRQVYKGLDLSSGKITKKEMKSIPHHCLDLVGPKTVFTAERYAKCARRAIKDIIMRKKTPIIVGGTGFYIDAALDRINIASVPSDPKLRARLEKKSADVLFQTLKGLDPARVKTIDLKNKRRLIRAIEVAKSKKRKKQRDQLVAYMQPVDLDILWLGIKTKPEELREKINKRLAKRLKTGMIAEIKKLHANPPAGGGVSWKRLDSLGLEPKWISKYLRGEITKEEMIKKLQTEIWRYSRRQITWFRRNKKIRWVSLKENLSKLF